jgi:hypothetical protein
VLEQGHKLELVEVPACRLVLGQGQACKWVEVQGHIEGQQRPQPREKTKQ